MNPLFEKFFSIGDIKVGPTIISTATDGNWLGTAHIFSTNKDIFLTNKSCIVGIRDYNNTITQELYNALNYLSIDKTEFDYFMNGLFIREWLGVDYPKPDISILRNRAYIYRK